MGTSLSGDLPSPQSLEKVCDGVRLFSIALKCRDDHPIVLLNRNGRKNVMKWSGHPGSRGGPVLKQCCLGIRIAIPGPECADPFAFAINMNESYVAITNSPSIIG